MPDKKPDQYDERAFPFKHQDAGGNQHRVYLGMMLRDYFAAAALNGFLSSQLPAQGVTNRNYADDSYRMADAMIAARAAESKAGEG